MTRIVILAIGLMMAGITTAGSLTGAIAVKLNIFSRCEITRVRPQAAPQINCGGHFSAQPRITYSVLKRDSRQEKTARLVTIEW
ncbi:MAG: hypothetical protein QRY16_10445 [Enterobacterales bacterium endosymbiont of Blomia tropicalis]|uniref:hypothetical protein n=1 Tax=Mixta mediterraneensis TaxID=2758443 RepID=UPI0025A92166|nr:hypothetical protein [Mixta mediterraneensis]MDL4914185.1 hypothetical protein [Mixta mediterraneensis]